VWEEVIDDLRHRALKPRYHGEQRPLSEIRVDRRLFRGKRYLPIGLIETGRGCRFPCEFCAIQTFFSRTYRARPSEDVIAELSGLKSERKLFFFVDDNFAASLKYAKELVTALTEVKVRWVTQMSINAAHDEEFLATLSRSGCQGVLIGFESLDDEVLKSMRKNFNTMRGGFEVALANLRRHNIRVYGTFVFGYDGDKPGSAAQAAEFSIAHNFYLAAFNHLTPFPGTPLYQRLQREGRLLHERWWLDERYRYNDLPFRPAHMAPDEVRHQCIDARKRFYSWKSMIRRAFDPVNRRENFMFRNFFLINGMHRAEVSTRDQFPLGDPLWRGELLTVA